ncbi:rRNA-processing protein EFG1 [Cryptococcus wingfieldii CBS 7118]|uniref:rRNA-processing protein EFG1 n=1 Tax=Cryptococcus wingfieldii CBS 7118 TaxID=1295528 RepID=A0A1E3J0D3_9TREE|nr:rRNA-processing protein EFG1 [Cryptococcus wingfieldii CBS 7118]ODN93421.1 rRNA-processing protein EFG1 [Cryptococcus wingfieldii CBS 7118]
MPADKKIVKKGAHPYRKPRDPAAQSDRPDNGHKVLPTEARDAAGLPGMSKLKGSIRQTKRLLAKDNLDPGLRVNTQRRLASLEADLAAAERRELEKKNGAKYHKVKFFERQKLLRLIKRFEKKLSGGEDEKQLKEKKRKRLEEELLDTRVMLNYILHFPNTQKYIAIFPSAQPSKPDDESEPKLTLPPLLHPVPSPSDIESLDKPARRRYDLLLETAKLMEEGKLKSEPEKDLKKGQQDGVVVGLGAGVEIGVGKGEVAAKEVEEDDFFESGDDE